MPFTCREQNSRTSSPRISRACLAFPHITKLLETSFNQRRLFHPSPLRFNTDNPLIAIGVKISLPYTELDLDNGQKAEPIAPSFAQICLRLVNNTSGRKRHTQIHLADGLHSSFSNSCLSHDSMILLTVAELMSGSTLREQTLVFHISLSADNQVIRSLLS